MARRSYRSPSSRYVRWDKVIREAQAWPEQWLLLLPDAPARTVQIVRGRRNRALRRDDGHLEAYGRNHNTDPHGIRRCDVWIRWIPGASMPTEGHAEGEL